VLWLLTAILFPSGAVRAGSPPPTVQVAAALSLSGDSYTFGKGSLEGVQLAVEEANASGILPRIELKIYDDRSTPEGAQEVAHQIINSSAALVLGPAISTVSLAAGPLYAEAGLASITTTATSDLITHNATTFRVVFRNSEQGEMLATYLNRVLGLNRANVIVKDDGYGHTIEKGFRESAGRLGIEAKYYVFKSDEEAAAIVSAIAGDPNPAAVVFATLDGEGARMLPPLRRLGIEGPFLGGDAFGDESFSSRMADLPEEKREPGYFSEGVYGISPVILDSANADILSFAERFHARYQHDPVWFSVAGYDAARLAIEAARAGVREAEQPNATSQRAAALAYIVHLNSPFRALPGLLGPIWFGPGRGRQQAIRVGRFNHGHIESAPVQIVPVLTPDAQEVKEGAVFEMRPGTFVRLQHVAYTGVYINDIPRVEPGRSSFGADFYVWIRFARPTGPGSPDPADIIFPNMISGSFDRSRPAEQGEMADGTLYRLWRVQGEFRNDFDLHRFPFDKQTLSLRFFNSRAAADRIVYVLDKRAPHTEHGTFGTSYEKPAADLMAAETLAIASPDAFRNLSQWRPLDAHQRRDNVVTDSSLGDPRRVGTEGFRELSGYAVLIDLQRQVLPTLTKNLLPLFLMTLIMYASLHFPKVMMTNKVTVTVTGVLSGAVLLGSINSQLGGVGYTVAVEYAFYVFFALGLLCIISVITAERLILAGHPLAARRCEIATRVIFLGSVITFLVVSYRYIRS